MKIVKPKTYSKNFTTMFTWECPNCSSEKAEVYFKYIDEVSCLECRQKFTIDFSDCNETTLVKISQLTFGDRFKAYGNIYTYIYTYIDITSDQRDGVLYQNVIAVRHGTESINLKENGYGYIGNPKVSFEMEDEVEFLPIINNE